MKKKFIFLAMMLLTFLGVNVLNAQEPITIGGDEGITGYIPATINYNYSYSQQIYLKDEINLDGCDITKIAFNFSAGSYGGQTVRNWRVYLLNTNEEAFSGASDYKTVTDADLFFEGDVTLSEGWSEIVLSKSFAYSGGNIIVAVQDHTGSSVSSKKFHYYSTTSRTIRCQSDYTVLGPNKYDEGNYAHDMTAQIKFTWESSVPAVMPSSVPEITSIEATHNSVILAWNAVENAKKYNVYTSTGDLVATVSATSCTIEGLDELTEYCYQVSAVNGEYETGKSAESCATTLEAPETRNIVFTLNDSYGDGWNGNAYLQIDATDGTSEQLKCSSGYSISYDVEITVGATVYVTYMISSNNWPDENSYCIHYDDETEIYCSPTMDNTSARSYTFTVESLAPKVTIAASAYDIYSDQTATLTATVANFDGDVEYSWSSNEGIVGTGATYTFDPTSTGSFEFTCTATDANDNEASASVTINVTERPIAPTNLQATNVTYNSVTLTWDAVDGATYYEIYKDAAHLADADATTYTATNLNPETTYSFTVKAANNTGTSPESEALSVRTEQLNGRIVVFELNDYFDNYYGDTYDSWNGNKLSVVFSSGETYEITNNGTAATEYYYLGVPYGTTVTVTYLNTGSYPGENTYYIRYSDDNSLIYQDGKAVNGSAPTVNVPFSFTVERPGPENLVIVEGEKTQLYPGETTKISWDALEAAVRYNVYVNDEAFASATENTYELENLPYGMNAITVTAVFEDGSESGMSDAVTVQMAGTFPLTIKVQDMSGNAVANASLTINGTDEYQVYRTFEGTTDDDGEWYKADMPLLYEYYSYNIMVSAEPFKDGYSYFYESDTENGVAFTKTIEMELPIIYPQTEKQSYDAKEDIVLMWDAVDSEYLEGYNVYVNDEEDPRNTEGLLESAIYTLEGGLDETGSVYVTAVYEGYGESGEGYGAYVNINAYGTISGTVTDGTNPIAGAEVVAKGIDNITWMESEYSVITDNNGKYELSVLPNSPEDYYAYSISVSKYGYESYTSTTKYNVVGGETTTIETIVLTANADVTFAVTATEGEGNVTVTWDAPEGATQYNVFRKDATEAVVKLTETPITEQEYLATDWNELSNGTYQYGVSAFVGGGSETLYTDDFSSDKGWSGQGNWTMSNGMYSFSMASGGLSRSRLSPTFTIGENAAIVKFDYVNTGANALTVYLECAFSITLGTIPAGTEGTFISAPIDREHFGIDVLNTNAQINFTCTSGGNSTTTVDNLVVYSESSPVESSINWATALTKDDANVFTGTGNWDVADNWSKGVPADGANVFIEGDVTIASNVNVNNMTINGGSVTINNGASLTVEGTLVNEAAANLVINDGAQIFQNNEDVPATFVMGITKPEEWQSDNKDGWQFISSPFTNASVFNFTNASEGNYDLFKYDGDEDLEWQNHKANAANFGPTFEQGVGYLASHETESTIELTGTLKAENYYSWNNMYYNEEKPLANFYLLGNPFPFNMDITKATFTNLVEGVAVVTSKGGYDYSQKTIPVGDAFFVQANGNDYNSSLSYGGRGARSEKSNSLNITATGNAGKDNVVINFAGKSEGFNKLQNFNDAIATVYVAEDGKNYGIYNCDADVQEVELNFNANKMGNYTISIEPDGEFETVTLVDRFTGVETNMLEGEYTFTAMSSDNHNRFIVRMVNRQQTTDNSHFVYQSGEELILNIQGEVQIVDVLGRVVYNGKAMNDINRINVSSFNSGAYMVRVMNGNEVKVEKIIL